MKIKNGYTCRRVAEQNVVIPTERTENETAVIVHLNDTGRFLWDLMAENTSTENLINAMLQKYEVDESIVREDVTDFLNTLRKADLIEE